IQQEGQTAENAPRRAFLKQTCFSGDANKGSKQAQRILPCLFVAPNGADDQVELRSLPCRVGLAAGGNLRGNPSAVLMDFFLDVQSQLLRERILRDIGQGSVTKRLADSKLEDQAAPFRQTVGHQFVVGPFDWKKVFSQLQCLGSQTSGQEK